MGDQNNLGMIGRNFAPEFNILRVDLVNHGKSFYRNEMDYYEMANDVLKVIDTLGIKDVIPVGHSMGGKVAMRLAFDYPDRVVGLIVLDIAPIIYGKRGHDNEFYALNQVRINNCQTRTECKAVLEQHLQDPGVIAFILKSFDPTEEHKFIFNAPILEKEYNHIGIWDEGLYQGPAAFIYGGASLYVSNPERKASIPPQFPQAKFYCVENASHWLHAEQPKKVFAYIQDFLDTVGFYR